MEKKINKIQQNLKSGRGISFLEVDDIAYIEKPLGKALFINSQIEQKKIKANPNDRIVCNICGRTYTRNVRSRHNKTKIHQAYANINSKFAKLVLNVDTNNIE